MRLGHIAELGKSFKMLKSEWRVGVSVSYIFKPQINGNVPWIKIRWPRVSYCRNVGKNVKYTVALFSALDVSVRKKNMRLARFSLHFARNRMTPCVANVYGNHYASTYFILSRISSTTLSSGLLEKTSTCHMYNTLLRIAPRVSTCIIHVQLVESRPEGQCLVSNK